MFCHNCGTKLDEGSLFCPECGARQQDAGQPAAESTVSVPPGHTADTDAQTFTQPASGDTTSQGFTQPAFTDPAGQNFAQPASTDPAGQTSSQTAPGSHFPKDKLPIIITVLIAVVGIFAGFFFSKNLREPKSTEADIQMADSMNTADQKQELSEEKEEAAKADKAKDSGTKSSSGEEKESNAKSNRKDSAKSNESNDESNRKDSAKDNEEDRKTDDKDDKTDQKISDRDDKTDQKTDDKDNKKPAKKVYIHEYTVVQGLYTWADAKAFCETQGGHLATATSQEEYEQIVAKANATGCLVLWLGAQRAADTGDFQWITNEDFSYGAWAGGEPNNDGGNENCLGMMKVNGVWGMYDMPGDVSPYYSASKVGFVMEKEIEQ